MKRLIFFILLLTGISQVNGQSLPQTYWTPGVPAKSISYSPTMRVDTTGGIADSLRNHYFSYGNKWNLFYSAAQQNLRFLRKADSAHYIPTWQFLHGNNTIGGTWSFGNAITAHGFITSPIGGNSLSIQGQDINGTSSIHLNPASSQAVEINGLFKLNSNLKSLTLSTNLDNNYTQSFQNKDGVVAILGDTTGLGASLQSKIFLKATDYNIVGDSTTDNTTAMRALFANPITKGAVVFFPAGSYVISDSVRVLYPCRILGAGPLAHYAGTVGPTPVVGSYVGGASIIVQTSNNKSALVLQADGTIVEGMNIKHPGTTSTSGSGIAINAGNGTRITNNFIEGFGIDVANYAGIDAYISFNQLANPGKYGGYQGGVIDDENGSAWLYNHFNSSSVAGITYLRIENAGGVRVIGNDAHIATGGYTGNYAAIAVDVLSGSTTGDLKIENNIFEAYTQTGIKIRQKSGTILQNGFIQGNLLNNALSGITGHDIDMKGISGGSLTRWTIQDNIISNSNSNASIYIENMNKLNLSHNQFNNTVPSQMDSLVNTTLVNDQVIGDLVVNNGKLRGGETNASNLNIQGTSGSGATGTTQAINFVDNFGVTKATFLNNGRWGFEGVTTPKSSIDALNASFGTYAGVTSAPANSIIVSGGISAGTTTAPAKFNAQLASGAEWQRVMFSSDQTFYHSLITGFSATPANSYLAIKVNNGTTNTQIEGLRLRGDGTILFPTYIAANGIAHVAGTTGVLSVSPIVGADITNSTIDLTTKVTGVLPVANGGTGQSTYINGQLLIGNTTGNTLSKATLSGTQGVSITNGAGTIGIGLGDITPTSINTSGNAIFTGPNFSYTNASAGTLGPVFAAGDATHANTTWQKYDGTAAGAIYGDGHFVVGGTITLKGYTVATLPTGVVGMTAYVTDALTPTFGNILVGGGAVVAKAFYNGTNWINE